MNSKTKNKKRTVELGKDSGSVYNIGTKRKYLNSFNSNFVLMPTARNVKCDYIGHKEDNLAIFQLSTNNQNIPLNIYICEDCIAGIRYALKRENNVSLGKNRIYFSKRRFLDNEHCLLCQNNKNNKYLIHIGKVEFCLCEKHFKRLKQLI